MDRTVLYKEPAGIKNNNEFVFSLFSFFSEFVNTSGTILMIYKITSTQPKEIIRNTSAGMNLIPLVWFLYFLLFTARPRT